MIQIRKSLKHIVLFQLKIMVLFTILQLLLVGVASSIPLCLPHERQALLTFKMAFTVSTYEGDGYPKTDSWKHGNIDCCQWDGITCDPSSGHVTELDLSCNILTGRFPFNSSLFHLRHLRHLNLADNNFSAASIPPELGRLSDLTYLDLSNSGFSGQVPDEIGLLSRLTTLDLSGISATMPNFKTIVANLTDLRDLDLSDVFLNSEIPPIIGNLTKLTSLTLTYCRLQGEFPATIVLNLPELRILRLGVNTRLYADFSTSFVNWRSPLEVVEFTSCSFTGKLPESIGDPSNSSLILFQIDGCGFDGNIPSWMWSSTVEFISMRNNRLGGNLPSNVNMTTVSAIDMSNNTITGMIPTWVFTQPSLRDIILYNNLFTGFAQDAINGSATPSTVTFSASNNQLQGQVPEAIFELRNLLSLDFAENNLTGTILLSKLRNLLNLQSLFLSANNLSIIDDMGSDSTSSWPTFWDLGLSFCNLGHIPFFLRQQPYIGSLDLSNNGIHGLVPDWFLDVGRINLRTLDLSHNFLTGGLESLSWKNIYEIDISSNVLKGAVPVLSLNTSYFWASNNRFTGRIPTSFCNMTSIVLLDLSQNNLTGNIPDCIGNPISKRLTILDLRQNQLQGVIPSVIFGSCPSLFTLSLNDNLLEGIIPQSLNNCVTLQLLDLGSNNLNGTFPHWLDVLPDLEALILGSNKLSGSIVSSNLRSAFLELRILDISNNDLVGSVPTDMLMRMKGMVKANNSNSWPYMGISVYQDSIIARVKGFNRPVDAILDTLVLIDASWNKLEGPIPEAIGDLLSLRWLNLAHNNFTGSIPPSLGNLSLLETLDLSYNRLDGQIPIELVNLNSLEVFNVSENNLVGPVPTSKQFATFSDSSYLGNPGLCGELLTNKCGKPAKALNREAADEGNNDESSSGLYVWEIALMGFGCGLFVGSVWGYCIFWKTSYYWVVKLIFKVEVFMMLRRRKKRQSRRN